MGVGGGHTLSSLELMEVMAMGLLSPCQHCCTHQRTPQHPSKPPCTSAASPASPAPDVVKLEGKSISCLKKETKQGSKVSVKYRYMICK